MSDPINANPTVLESSALPTRETVKSSIDQDGLDLLSSQYKSISIFDSIRLYEKEELEEGQDFSSDDDFDVEQDPFDSQEIYDPEHPLTLGQLAVVNLPHIKVNDSGDPNQISEVIVEITPTITHCSLATLIGLGIRVRLERCLPARFRIIVNVRKGTHQSEGQVNKQLNDKERVAAACENDQLLSVISNMLSTCI